MLEVTLWDEFIKLWVKLLTFNDLVISQFAYGHNKDIMSN